MESRVEENKVGTEHHLTTVVRDHQHVSKPQTNNSQFHNSSQYPVPYTQGTFRIIFPGYRIPIIPREQMPVVYSLM